MEELVRGIEAYKKQWESLMAEYSDEPVLHGLTPTAVAWKVADLDEYNRLLVGWQGRFDQLQSKWMNDRWITCAVLRAGEELAWGIRIVKLMQRRPGSDDALGLDHVDFYSPEVASTRESLLANATGLKITSEKNGSCEWLSLWFYGMEAKLRTNTTLHVCADELLRAEQQIVGK